jgi:hypothetical protein
MNHKQQIEDMGKCACVCTSWHFDFSKNELRKKVLRKNGIQMMHRPGFWSSSLHVAKVQRKIIKRGDAKNNRTPLMYYMEYVHHHRLPLREADLAEGGEETSKHDPSKPDILGTAGLDKVGPEGEILRDVSRTFPSAEFFKDEGKGQNMLANVLKACLRAEPGVGYCQGMNFVAATLLRACVEANDEKRRHDKVASISSGGDDDDDDTRAEADAFWLMMALMDSDNAKAMDMTGMWSSGVPALRLRCFQFDALLKTHSPKLHAHLHTIGLATEVLASQWFLTLFAYALPFESTIQCWDEVFLDGWTQILKVAIGHLKVCEESLLPLT